jgi:hypothetical protein
MSRGMEFQDLETVYDLLANAIDDVGRDNEAIFLSKVCLILSHSTGDLNLVETSIESAKQDLCE